MACPSIYLFLLLSIYLFIYLPVCLPIYLFLYFSYSLSVYLSALVPSVLYGWHGWISAALEDGA